MPFKHCGGIKTKCLIYFSVSKDKVDQTRFINTYIIFLEDDTNEIVYDCMAAAVIQI